MPRPVRFTGRVVQAKETRGPQNKDFTRNDLEKLLPSLRGVQLMYNHGDDQAIGSKAIGTISHAYIDSEGYLVVRGQTDDGTTIGDEAFTRIRDELLDNTLPMLSIHWTAQTLNHTADEAEKVADPDKKVVKEISLVEKGYYPEAMIMEVQCSGDRLRWKTGHGIYTDSGDDTTSKPPTEPRQTMSDQQQQQQSAQSQKHARLFRQMGKLTEEQVAELQADPYKILDVYATIFPELMDKVGSYEQKEKRERDAYKEKQTKTGEELYEKIKDHFPEDMRESAKKRILETAADYDRQEEWKFLTPVFSKLHEQGSKLSEMQKIVPNAAAPPAADNAPPAMSLAASLQRGQASEQQAKRIAPPPSADWGPTLGSDFEQRLAERVRARIQNSM